MKMKGKHLLILAGIISTTLGIVYAIPSFMQNKIGLATVATFFIVGGLVLLALGFGEE